jgi:polyisoprenoid-binding protein YceI
LKLGWAELDEMGDIIVHATKPLEDPTVRYVIDAKASTFSVQVFATGLLASFGHDPKIAIRNFQGDVNFNLTGLTLEHGRLNISIQATSLDVVDDISEKDRQEIHRKMCNEVLEIDRFPEIIYECSRVSASGSGDRFWVALNGELSLHGVTKAHPVSARVTVDVTSVRAAGEFSVRQSDYEIAPVSAAAGAIKIKDEVKCTFDIVARKQDKP